MKSENKLKVFLLFVLGLFLFGPGQASMGQEVPASNSNSTKQITSVRSEDAPNGSRIILTFNSPIKDYGAYRNGDKFLVLISNAELALTEIVVRGTGFSNSKVEARGTNLAFSFQLDSDVKPSVTENGNRLEVAFFRPGPSGVNSTTQNGTTEVSSLEMVRARAETSTVTSNSVNGDGGTSPPSGLSPSAQPPRGAASAAASATRTLRAPEASGADTDNITLRQVDLSVPESPAFTVLGVTPEVVTRPTTPREFATSFLNGVDQNGNFQTGLAMDFAPFLTFFGEQTSLFSYRNSRMERFLARTQVSFATTKGVSEDDKATRLAVGARFTLWDKGDPRLDDELDKCYKSALQDRRLTHDLIRPFGETPEQEAIRLAKRKEVLTEVVKACNDVARKVNWNASGWVVGVAPSWISESGETKDFGWNGAGVWTSVAYGFENVSALKNNSQLILHARYRNNEIIPDSENAGQFLSQDSFFFGGRLRLAPGSTAKSILSVEGNYIRSRVNKGAYDNSSRFSLGFERRIIDNIWFSLSVGGHSGRADGNNNAFVLSSFKWGFDQKK